MKLKIAFVINPISGIGRQNKIEEIIKNSIDLDKFDFSLEYTKYHKHATLLSKELSKRNDIIVAVGGDGTINEISKSLIDTNVMLGIIPIGSGNGIARHFKIPLDIKKSIERINRLRFKKIDTATLNNEPFVMLSGFGFDSKIAYKFKMNKKRGFWGYAKLILKNILSYKSEEYEIIIDGIMIKKKAYLITVANCSQFGNNVVIAPCASAEDNVLDIVVINDVSMSKKLMVFLRLLNGTLEKSRYVDFYKGREIRIRQKNQSAQIDGESFLSGSDISIRVNHESLSLIC